MDTTWLNDEEMAAWVRLAAVLELLPGVLDSQLRRDAELTHFEYYALAMLSEAPQRTLRMTALAAQTNATLPRLSHVIGRLEDRGLVERFPCPQDARATNVRLTPAGWDKVRHAAPGHVANVRQHVIDALTPEQVRQLAGITDAILRRLDPDGTMAAIYHRYDPDPPAAPRAFLRPPSRLSSWRSCRSTDQGSHGPKREPCRVGAAPGRAAARRRPAGARAKAARQGRGKGPPAGAPGGSAAGGGGTDGGASGANKGAR